MTQNATETLLERERQRKDLTYEELAGALGVKRQSAWRYCKGLQRPERGKGGEDGPAERLEAWSGGRIHAGNCHKPVAAPRRTRGR